MYPRHRAAALEAPRGIRVNVVSPPWVTETLQAMGRRRGGLPAAVVAKAYVRSVEGKETGRVLSPSDGAGHGRDAAGRTLSQP